MIPGVAARLDEPLTDRHQQVMTVLEVVRVEEHVPMRVRLWTGRPAHDRRPLARAFVATVTGEQLRFIADLPLTKSIELNRELK